MQSTGHTSTHDRSLMSMQGSAMMYVTGGLLYRGCQLLDELCGALLQRVLDDDLVEAGSVRSSQAGRIRMPTEPEDRHVGEGVRDLLRIDARDVRDHEVRPVSAVRRHEVVPC